MTANAVTCLSWVRCGVAKSCPDRLQLSEDQLKELVRHKTELGEDGNSSDGCDEPATRKKKTQMDKVADDENKAQSSSKFKGSSDDIENKYNLDDYDNSDDDDYAALSMAGLSFYSSNADDPYLNKGDDDNSDDDMAINLDDNLVVLGRLKDKDQFSLEVWVYNETSGSQYCHHDVILAKCPLTMEWVGYDPGEQGPGNLAAVGYLTPEIELWDLDVVNTLDPAFVLGGRKSKTRVSKKKKTTGHTDSVMSLSWNHHHGQILASGSADNTVGIWDLMSGTATTFLVHHSDKVGTIQWHPVEPQTLATGSYDACAKVFDCRTPDSHRSWNLNGQVTNVLWNQHDPFYFLASTDTGFVHCIDVRSASDPVFSWMAHASEVSGLAMSPSIPGCLVTSSDDHFVKVWDMRQSSGELVATKKYKIGSVFCVAACPDAALVFGVGGEHEMKILNLKRDGPISERFMGEAVKPRDSIDATANPIEELEEHPKRAEANNPVGKQTVAANAPKNIADRKKHEKKLKKKLVAKKKKHVYY